MSVMTRGVRAGLASDKPLFTINADGVLVAKVRHRDIDQPCVFLAILALEYLTVQRALVSFCAALAGSSGQTFAALSPALARALSSLLIRWRGADTRVASTICPPAGLSPRASSGSTVADNRSR